MALVLLPGLSNLIDDISEEKKLPPQVVEAALREALLKGYERYRRTMYLGISEDPLTRSTSAISMSDSIWKKRDTGFWRAKSSWMRWKAKTTRSPWRR